MSSDQDKSLLVIAVPTETKEKPVLHCTACQNVIQQDENHVVCQCNDTFCAACSTLIVTMMISYPALGYPFKCLTCLKYFDDNLFLSTINQQGLYERFISCVLPLFWSKDCLQENEKIVSCPFCPYIEIHTIDACPISFFSCQNPSCEKKSCSICHHQIEDDENLSIHRIRCIELSSLKNQIEEAIEHGSKQRCPHCQLTGLKDDACTHIFCQRCQNSWCYFCGKKEGECSVPENVQPSLSAHNLEWESNEKRCPMGLVQVQEIDSRWPNNDQECLEYFHRYRTLNRLYDVWKEIGDDKFNEINRIFGTIDASGYSIEEILDFPNRIFIDYSSNENS